MNFEQRTLHTIIETEEYRQEISLIRKESNKRTGFCGGLFSGNKKKPYKNMPKLKFQCHYMMTMKTRISVVDLEIS